MDFLISIKSLSLIFLLVGVGLAFSHIRLSGWILGWILLAGALLLQGFRSMLSYVAENGGVDATTYTLANEWMGLGFSLLIVASMLMMREVFARHRMAVESLRAVSAAANDAIVVLDSTGTIIVWNQAAQRIFGFDKQESLGKKLPELIVPERLRMDFKNMFDRFGRDGRGSVSDSPTEQPGLRKDGTEIVTEYSMSRANIDGKWHAIYIVRDISARKQAEEEIRARAAVLEALSARMLSSDEMDKKKLAFGLHEGLAQTLVTIKMRIERKLAQFAKSRNYVRDEPLEAVVPLLQSAIEDVKTIATGLRPSGLDDLGLLPTLGRFCREFERRHPSICVSQEISVQESELPAPLKIVIYRITESAFNVIARHENSEQIGLGLEFENGAVTLSIEDESQDTRYAGAARSNADAELQLHFGEARERTTLSGGTFSMRRGKADRVALRATWSV